MEKEYITVTQLNTYMKNLIDSDSNLKEVYVKGEISNFNQNAQSGHCYFKVKDKNSLVPGVMYYGWARRLKFKPQNGMSVLIEGYVEVFHRNGQYQLYAKKITEDGLGNLYIAYEQLKKKLEAIGWFDDAHKKEIPKFPKRIGVITASTGAAIRDIIITIQRRWPLCEIIVFPTLVQGNKAANNIVRQIYLADTQFDLDTIIVGRGGGSIEDLWAFNEEIVAKTIYHCNTPIISAVGHETDSTIADYVADLRAATPTAAAELAVPDINEIKSNLSGINLRINKSISKQYAKDKEKLDKIKQRNLFYNPYVVYEKKYQNLDILREKLLNSSNKMVSENKDHLESLKRRLFECSNMMIYDNRLRLSKVKASQVFKNPDKLFENKSNRYSELKYKLKYSGDSLIFRKGNRLDRSRNSFVFKNPERILETKQSRYFETKARLSYSSNNLLRDKKDDLRTLKESAIIKNPDMMLDKKRVNANRYIDKLMVLNPLNTIKRGYTVSRLNGKIVSKSKDLKKDDELEVEFSDGKINARVL